MFQVTVVEKNKTHFYVQHLFLSSVVWVKMCKKVVREGRPQMTI